MKKDVRIFVYLMAKAYQNIRGIEPNGSFFKIKK